MLANALTVL